MCAELIVTNSIRATRLIDVIDFSLPFTIVVFAHRYTECWVGAKWSGRRNRGKEKEQRNFFSSLCWIARKVYNTWIADKIQRWMGPSNSEPKSRMSRQSRETKSLYRIILFSHNKKKRRIKKILSTNSFNIDQKSTEQANSLQQDFTAKSLNLSPWSDQQPTIKYRKHCASAAQCCRSGAGWCCASRIQFTRELNSSLDIFFALLLCCNHLEQWINFFWSRFSFLLVFSRARPSSAFHPTTGPKKEESTGKIFSFLFTLFDFCFSLRRFCFFAA